MSNTPQFPCAPDISGWYEIAECADGTPPKEVWYFNAETERWSQGDQGKDGLSHSEMVSGWGCQVLGRLIPESERDRLRFKLKSVQYRRVAVSGAQMCVDCFAWEGRPCNSSCGLAALLRGDGEGE